MLEPTIEQAQKIYELGRVCETAKAHALSTVTSPSPEERQTLIKAWLNSVEDLAEYVEELLP